MAVPRSPEVSTGSVAHTANDAEIGRPSSNGLEPRVREQMESAFGADFSNICIREDSEADAIGARAFTRGTDIHFAAGRYQPGTPEGKALIGHELAHVVQKAQGRVRASFQAQGLAINDEPSLEDEADHLGARAARGERVADLGG